MSRQARVLLFSTVLLALIVAITGCGKGKGGQAKSSVTINGAGATFPYPVYAKWAYKYQELNGTKINYQSIGSGGGIQQIKQKTVDFGASDAPLTKAELDQAGLVQFPMIMGGVVPVVNISGIKPGGLKLTSTLLADIFLGKVKKWNDPAIVKVNPGLKLPNKAISVIHRADGSGTTWIFTNYLDNVSKNWHSKVGMGKAVSWPAGSGGKGNEGVSAYVQRLDGTIGYVEYAYALQNKMTYVQLQNKAGKFVNPSIKAFQSAAENADWKNTPGFYVVLVNQPGENSWPITGASYILVHKKQSDAKKAREMLGFFDWSYRHGNDLATELDYVPVPANVIDLVESMWAKDITADGKPAWVKK